MDKVMKSISLTLMIAFSILMVALRCSHQSESSPISFPEIVQTQFQRYPQMQVEDLYKLTYQAAMGNIHLGVDQQILKDYLYSELERIKASDDEPLFEKISPDNLIRLNLGPFKAKGGNPEKLFEAMMQTAQTFQPDSKKIIQYWKGIERMAEENSIPFRKTELDSFLSKMQEADFPAIHHSDKYLESYHPAYRVILRQYLPDLK